MGNIRFFKSNQVKIFPCSRRIAASDPESRFTTERNLTSLGGWAFDRDSYVIEAGASSNDYLWRLIIKGYYFEIQDANIEPQHYFAIGLEATSGVPSRRLGRLNTDGTGTSTQLYVDSAQISGDLDDIVVGDSEPTCFAICLCDQDTTCASGIYRLKATETLGSISGSYASDAELQLEAATRLANDSALDGRIQTNAENISSLETALEENQNTLKKYAEDEADVAQSAAEAKAAELDTALHMIIIGEDTDTAHAKTIKGAKDYAKDYADSLANNYDVSGSANEAKLAVIGKSGDAKTADTIYGAKAFATDLNTAMNARVMDLETASAAHTEAIGDENSGLVKVIADETAAREQADSAINDKIGELPVGDGAYTTLVAGIADARTYAEELVKALTGQGEGEGAPASLAAETAARKEADDTLTNLITAEKGRAKDVEAGLADRISTMEAFWDATEDSDDIINKLKEIQDYIAADETGAAAMASDIQTNTNAIALLNGDEEGSVSKKIADAIAPLATNKALNGVKATAEAAATQTYVETELAKKADETALENYYTKEDTYSKSETDTAIAEKISKINGGQSAGEVKAELVEYRYAIDAELWGEAANNWTTRSPGEDGKETITYNPVYSTASRIDTLENGVNTLVDTVGNTASGEEGQEGYAPPTGIFEQLALVKAKSDDTYSKSQIDKQCKFRFNDGVIKLLTPEDYQSANIIFGETEEIDLKTWLNGYLSNYLANHLNAANHWTLNLTAGDTYMQTVEIYYLADYKTPTAEDALDTECKDEYKDYYYWRLTVGEAQYFYCKAGETLDLSKVPNKETYDLALGLYACKNGIREFIPLTNIEEGFELSKHDYNPETGKCECDETDPNYTPGTESDPEPTEPENSGETSDTGEPSTESE